MPGLQAAHRVTFFLPVNTPEERLAATEVVGRIGEIVGAYTRTTFQPPVITGFWVDAGELYVDELALTFVDLLVSEYPPDVLEKTLEGIRERFFDAYREVGSPQVQMWTTVEAIQVYGSD